MPFEAAKAVAATFCYNIRYALVPIFGPSFVSACIKPGTEGFGQMIIDSEIVARSTLEAKHYRETASSERFEESRSNTPESKPTLNEIWPRQVKSRPLKMDSDSAYSSDANGEGNYLPSPQSTIDWNPPRTSKPWPGTLELPEPHRTKKVAFVTTSKDRADSPGSTSSGSDVSPTTVAESRREDQCIRRNSPKALHGKKIPRDSNSPNARSQSPITATKETKAAYVLMQLRLADTSWREPEHSTKKRRASS